LSQHADLTGGVLGPSLLLKDATVLTLVDGRDGTVILVICRAD
jgi:hypothetical protein